MINLKSIRGTNFRSFKEFNLEIKDGLWMVKGINNDDSLSDSNGAGKSSIFVEAPYWCLTGKTTVPMDSADDIVNLSAGKDCLVEMILESPDGEIKVTRTRKHKDYGNNLLLEINEQNVTAHRVSDTQKRLDSLIKVSPEILKSTIVMASDISNKFTELTPAARVSLLESIRDYHVWEEIRNISKSNLDDLTNKINILELSKSKHNGSIETIRDIIRKYSTEYDEENKKELNRDELGILGKQIDKISSETKSIESRIKDLEPHVKSLIEAVNKSMDMVTSSNAERLRLDKEKSLEEEKKLKYQSRLDICNREFHSNGVCPTCGKPYDIPDQRKRELEEEIKECSEGIIECNTKIEKFKESIDNSISYKVSADLVCEKNNAEKELSEYKNSLLYKNKELTELKISHDKLESDINNHDFKLLNIMNSIKEYKSKLIESVTEIEKADNEIKSLQGDSRVYKFYYDCLGPRGNLRPYLLNRDIDFINRSLKHYSDMMFSSVIVSLSKPTVEDNKIDIIIKTSSGLVKSIGMLSKGELRRVDLCIQFAIYDLIKSTSMFNTNILILDEIFDGLDVSGLNRVVDLLLERSDFIPSMYIISHNPNISNLIHSRVTVEKTHDISKISYNSDILTEEK